MVAVVTATQALRIQIDAQVVAVVRQRDQVPRSRDVVGHLLTDDQRVAGQQLCGPEHPGPCPARLLEAQATRGVVEGQQVLRQLMARRDSRQSRGRHQCDCPGGPLRPVRLAVRRRSLFPSVDVAMECGSYCSRTWVPWLDGGVNVLM